MSAHCTLLAKRMEVILQVALWVHSIALKQIYLGQPLPICKQH